MLISPTGFTVPETCWIKIFSSKREGEGGKEKAKGREKRFKNSVRPSFKRLKIKIDETRSWCEKKDDFRILSSTLKIWRKKAGVISSSDERDRERRMREAKWRETEPSIARLKIYITHRPTLNSCCIRSRCSPLSANAYV